MLIIALVLAVIGLASLVAAVVTSNEVIAWVCIGASVIGVLLLIVDALRDRSRRDSGDDTSADHTVVPEPEVVQDYPDEETIAAEADVAEASEAVEAPEPAEPANPEAEHKS